MMPESTKSGGSSSRRNRANLTQSDGVPLQAQAVTPSTNSSSARSARRGVCRVRPWPVAERSWSGQTTVTRWPRRAASAARARMPAANTPSSLLIRIRKGAIAARLALGSARTVGGGCLSSGSERNIRVSATPACRSSPASWSSSKPRPPMPSRQRPAPATWKACGWACSARRASFRPCLGPWANWQPRSGP